MGEVPLYSAKYPLYIQSRRHFDHQFDHHMSIPRKSNSSCFVFWGFGFGVLGMGFRVVVFKGLGLRVQGFGVGVQRSGVLAQRAVFRVRVLGLRV